MDDMVMCFDAGISMKLMPCVVHLRRMVVDINGAAAARVIPNATLSAD